MNEEQINKLAWAIMDKMYYYCDGYYTSDEGDKQIVEVIEEVIRTEINGVIKE